nr:MAG TPA: hypothetical protein [Caudoviricetes sp.]
MLSYALAYTLAMVILCTGLHACNGYPMHWLSYHAKITLNCSKIKQINKNN